MRKKITIVTIFLVSFLMISTATAVNITNSRTITENKLDIVKITNKSQVEYNILSHMNKITEILGLNSNTFDELEKIDFEKKEFITSLFNQILNTDEEQDIQNILFNIENNFDENDVKYFYNTVNNTYDEKYMQLLITSVEKAFNENNFDEIITSCNIFKESNEFNEFNQYILENDKQEYIKTFEIIKNQYKLNLFVNNIKNNPSYPEKTGLLEFWFAWIINWVILVVDFFENFHPIAYKIIEAGFPLIILFFPMTYILFIVAFFKTLSDYFPSSKQTAKQVFLMHNLFYELEIKIINIFEKMIKKFQLGCIISVR